MPFVKHLNLFLAESLLSQRAVKLLVALLLALVASTSLRGLLAAVTGQVTNLEDLLVYWLNVRSVWKTYFTTVVALLTLGAVTGKMSVTTT